MILLPKTFYLQDALTLAPQLLGKILVVRSKDNYTTSAMIVETEAYCGLEDKGNHAKEGRRTPKNESMYLEGGHTYIYKCYGVHDMLNVVSGDSESGEAVLIRAVSPIENLEWMMENRKMYHNDYRLTGGPGKVCQAMAIDKGFDALPLYDANSPIQIFEQEYKLESYFSGPRVGMSRHVAECSNWPRRFYIEGNKYVSKPLKVWYDW